MSKKERILTRKNFSAIPIIGLFLILTLFFVSFVSAQGSYVRAAPAYTYGQQTSSFFGLQNYPQIDPNMCNNRQDFILQVDPLGCTPSVVTSDLLGQQNVPVFCPIVATQLNPLMSVNAINNMILTQQPGTSFSNNIAGVNYFPAQAALGQYNPSITSQYLGNIGYATIVLRQQPNESAMPSFVQGNITAQISYNIQNAFGVGNAAYYLQTLNDSDFNNNINAYSFWNGKGFVRLDSADNTGATVSIYSGVSGAASQSTAKQKIATLNLKPGETSSDVYLPGFGLCMGGLKVQLNDLENPDTVAKIVVDSNVVDLKAGDSFLDGKCTVNTITKYGINQNVQISCSEDQQHSSFALGINPKINLTISNPTMGTVTRPYSVGDHLFDFQDGSKTYGVYLGFIGNNGKTGSINDAYLWLLTVPSDVSTETSLSNDEVASIASLDSHLVTPTVGQGFWGAAITIGSDLLRGAGQGIKTIVTGKGLTPISYSSSGTSVGGTNIQILGYAGAYNADISKLPGNVFTSYTNAMNDYQTIVQNYGGETSATGSSQTTYGEQALEQEINLAGSFNQKKTALQLCQQYSQSYGPAPDNICNDPVLLSSTSTSEQSVIINGQTHTISFEGITAPSFDQFGVKLTIGYPNNGVPITVTLQKNQIYYVNETTGEYIQLTDLTPTSATFTTNLVLAGTTLQNIKNFASSTGSHTLKVGTQDNFGGAYTFAIQQINLQQVAKVSIQSDINYAHSNASFSFKIGIEKSAIQLTPNQTKQRISDLNKTINQWQSLQNDLNTVVKVGKTACLITEVGLLAKNFVANLGGAGVARQAVMRNSGGWDDKCAAMVKAGQYTSVENCLQANSAAVDASVNTYDAQVQAQNQNIQTLSQGLPTTTVAGEKVADSGQLFNKINSSVITGLSNNANAISSNGQIKVGNQNVNIADAAQRINSNTATLSQVEQLQLNLGLINSNDPTVKAVAQNQVQNILGQIYSNSNLYTQQNDLTKQYGAQFVISSNEKLINIPLSGETFSQLQNVKGLSLPGTTPVQLYRDQVTGQNYLLVLNSANVITQTYQIAGDGTLSIVNQNIANPLKLNPVTANSFNNKYLNPTVQYFETGQYAGLPAIVPFDIQNGWYAAIKSNLPNIPVVGTTGNINSYESSTRVSSFFICNVGQNGKEDNMGVDDNCEQFTPGSSQQPPLFSGALTATQSQALETKAINAIQQATSQKKSGITQIAINGVGKINVGQPSAGTPAIQCEDFESPSDCNILFNVCDPVICPSSRCNLGGAYTVQDVIQSGIIGSLALCYPNFPQIKIPICLSGVNAGLQGYISVLKSYQQCLQTNLNTGQQVGICDEVNSVYQCQFFWKQLIPVVNYALPKIAGNVLGQNSGTGGGEYLAGTDALTNAQKSVDYFSQYYAANSYKAFQERSTESVGDSVCQNFMSLSTPNGGNLFDALITPDSPVQFYGQFNEAPYTTATNPPTSQYNVFYHIYAGTDFPAYYQVYLKGSASSFYQDTGVSRVVATGVVPVGQFMTNTSVFTAPSGYQQLCIVVNGQEQCGFKQVTTDFGVNYVQQQYLSSQASQTNITSQANCNSGTPSLYSLLNPNAQAGVTNAANPAIYNQGIIRICSTNNPAQGTDPNWNTPNARWQKVGYCDTQNIGCWLDTQSVSNVIQNQNILNATLQPVTSQFVNALQAQNGFFDNQGFSSYLLSLDTLRDQHQDSQIISSITQNLSKASLSIQKAELYLRRGNAYGDISLAGNPNAPSPPVNPNAKPDGASCAQASDCQSNYCDQTASPPTCSSPTLPTINVNSGTSFESPVFQFHDGTVYIKYVSGSSNLYYKFTNGQWYWSSDQNNWFNTVASPTEQSQSGLPGATLSSTNQYFITNLLNNYGTSYSGGLSQLLKRTTDNKEGVFGTSLTTDNVQFSNDGTFTVNGIHMSPGSFPLQTKFRFSYTQNQWQWSPASANDWTSVSQYAIQGTSGDTFSGQLAKGDVNTLLNALNAMQGSDAYAQGAAVIFSIDAPNSIISSGTQTGTGNTGGSSSGTTGTTGTGNIISCTDQQSCQTALQQRVGSTSITCVNTLDCQNKLSERIQGEKILQLAEQIKQNFPGISDSDVQSQTGAQSFECLALQISMTESGMHQCALYFDSNGNPLYCEGNPDEVIFNGNGNEGSFGIMQINSKVHTDISTSDLSYLDKDVNYGLNLLISGYNAQSTNLYSTCIPGQTYIGWNRAIRNYNGWGCQNPGYVDSVEGARSKVGLLFPQCA